MSKRARAWLDILRISNLPTCLSNVLVGWAIGGAPDRMGTLAFVAGVVCVLYVAGMMLNDVVDAPWDREHRPERPIPRGLIRRGTAGWISVFLLAAATGSTVLIGPAVFAATALLAALIIVYDLAHRIWPVAILGMASCRAMVYLVAAIAATEAVPGVELTLAMVALGTWTAGLTMLARYEASERVVRWPFLLLPLAGVIVIFIGSRNLGLATLTGSILVLQILWIANKLRIPGGLIPAVLASIAGISLLDAFLLGMLGAPTFAMIAVCCFAVVTVVHRPLPGT